MHNYHLVLTQGMVKLFFFFKKEAKCMKEIKARHENYFYRQFGLSFEVQQGVMYCYQLGFHTYSILQPGNDEQPPLGIEE